MTVSEKRKLTKTRADEIIVNLFFPEMDPFKRAILEKGGMIVPVDRSPLDLQDLSNFMEVWQGKSTLTL